jgi:1-deoxy-D-xylulose-5-phosphate synthase
MGVLDSIGGPVDLRRLAPDQLPALADEIRQLLIDSVCAAGGHLGPNLGTVELTIALHRVFGEPQDRIVFDTGHQAYTHKILTGRREQFASLRRLGGLSGYPNRAESDHDIVENSHASTGLSYAEGIARGYALDKTAGSVVAVVGDGALTGGLAWEALNNLATSPGRVIVVLNDNGRSYAPTVGGLADHLSDLRSGDAEGRNLFECLGLSYLGPVDAHDIASTESALRQASGLPGTVIVHCVSRKGNGYAPAEADNTELMHSVGAIDPATGLPRKRPGPTWTNVFGDELVALGETHPGLVAVSAAMIGPTGLSRFAERYPHRAIDVGIAEQHAVTQAAGLAMTGKHPVVAIYATFANRAFDQILLDVGLHRLPVTFVLDRAGITGPDGPSHHGMWDLALLGLIPGLRIAAPRDAETLREELGEAVAHDKGPTAVRFPKEAVGEPIPAVGRVHGIDLLHFSASAQTLLLPVGAMAAATMQAARLVEDAGQSCTVADLRWVRPLPAAVTTLAGRHRQVIVIEDGLRSSGVGAALSRLLTDAGIAVPVRVLGLPDEYVVHGGRDELLARYGLDAAGIATAVMAGLPGERPDGLVHGRRRQIRSAVRGRPQRELR